MSKREARVVIASVLVRLDANEFGIMHAVARPGEPRAHTLTRCMMDAVLPRNMVVRFRIREDDKRHHICPDWITQGPMTLDQALFYVQALERKSYYEMKLEQVDAKPPPAVHADPEEDDEPSCKVCERVLDLDGSCEDCGDLDV